MAQNKAVEAFNANVDALIARLQHAKALAAEALSKPGAPDKEVGVEKLGSGFRSDEIKEIADQ